MSKHCTVLTLPDKLCWASIILTSFCHCKFGLALYGLRICPFCFFIKSVALLILPRSTSWKYWNHCKIMLESSGSKNYMLQVLYSVLLGNIWATEQWFLCTDTVKSSSVAFSLSQLQWTSVLHIYIYIYIKYYILICLDKHTTVVHLYCATALYWALWISCYMSGSQNAGKIKIWDSIAQFSFGEISQWSVELLHHREVNISGWSIST